MPRRIRARPSRARRIKKGNGSLRTLQCCGEGEGTSNSLLDIHPAARSISFFSRPAPWRGRHGERQRGLVFNLLQGEARLDVSYAGNGGKKIENEALERRHVRYHHAQQVVGIAGHQVALHHLRALARRLLEYFE